jgi:hypothetical protein
VLRLLKSIRPRKFAVNLHIGTGDPAQTGQICAVFGMIYPFIGNYVSIEPEMEEKIYEGDFCIKGHITVFMLLRAALVIFFDKDIKRLIAIVKKAEKEEDSDG